MLQQDLVLGTIAFLIYWASHWLKPTDCLHFPFWETQEPTASHEAHIILPKAGKWLAQESKAMFNSGKHCEFPLLFVKTAEGIESSWKQRLLLSLLLLL